MGKVFYGTGVSDTERGDYPALRVLNMVPETESSEEGLVLNSRLGLEDTGVTLGTGAIKKMYQVDGVFNDELFAISGLQLHGLTTGLIGTINGTGPAYMAGYEDSLFACAGSDIWNYSSGTLTGVPFPDSADVLAIAGGASRIIAIRKGTGQFYWTDPLSATFDPLSFATAENTADKLKDLLFIGDTLILFGSKTVEFWPVSTANPDLPFQPLQGRVFQKGVKETGAATKFEASFAWVTNDDEVCMSDPNNVISSPTIERKISESSSVKLWTFDLFATEYLALQTDTQTFCFSMRYKEWVEFSSFGQNNWLPISFSGGYFGSRTDGKLYRWNDEVYQDFGSELERRLTMWVPIDAGTMPLYNLICRVATGTGTSYVDAPEIELRISKDGGFTWSPWRQKSLKLKGQYGEKINFRSLGSHQFPGTLIEIRVTDNTPFRFAGANANDGY